MTAYIRADFDFTAKTQGIGHCKGYVIGKFTPTAEGGNFKPENVIIKKLIANNPDFEVIEKLAIQNCKVIYD